MCERPYADLQSRSKMLQRGQPKLPFVACHPFSQPCPCLAVGPGLREGFKENPMELSYAFRDNAAGCSW